MLSTRLGFEVGSRRRANRLAAAAPPPDWWWSGVNLYLGSQVGLGYMAAARFVDGLSITSTVSGAYAADGRDNPRVDLQGSQWAATAGLHWLIARVDNGPFF